MEFGFKFYHNTQDIFQKFRINTANLTFLNYYVKEKDTKYKIYMLSED